MQPFDDLKKHCEKNRNISAAVIDQFLIHYAADKAHLVPGMETTIKRYKYAAADIGTANLNHLRAEYIAHRIFRKDGLIHKFLKHAALQVLPQDEIEFLRYNSENPWRFSFAVISSNPDDSFFRMEDVMTGEEYLLYSPGMQTTLTEYKPLLWFNLIGFNGLCWQTFGLMIPFLALTADDIFFFATELNPNIDGEEALMEEVERNPIPFFMLVTASNKPVVTSRGYVTLTCQSTDNIPDLQVEKLGAGFEVTKKIDVYRLSLKKLQTFPHFAEAYYNQKTGELLRTSMTQHGFSMLTAALAKKGIHLSTEADIVVSPVMLYTAEKILNRKIVLNPYSQYFSSENEGAEENPDLSGINTFIGLALPFYNQGKEVDIDKLATQAGIDPSMAADLWQQVKKKTDEMRNKKY